MNSSQIRRSRWIGWGALWTSAMSITLLGCPRTPVRKPNTAPLPKPEEALQLLKKGAADRRSLRALGKVTYFGKEGRVRVKAALLAERPGSFRVETISPFEQPIDTMTCDGERLWLLSQGRLREGPATPENIARLLPLLMRPEEVVSTLLGGVPLGDSFQVRSLEWAEDQVHWLLSMENNFKEVGLLKIDPARKVVEEMSLTGPDGKVRLKVDFDGFELAEQTGATEFPRKIQIEMPEEKMDVKIKLVEFEVNVPLQKTLFKLNPPGITPEPLGSQPMQLSSP